MNLQQQILDEMKRKKVSAHVPLLKNMYSCSQPLVSSMQHTKNGITLMAYLPTSKKVAPAQVRREITPQKQEADTMMNNVDSELPAELRLLSYILLNQNCSLSQAERDCKLKINCANGYLSWYFKEGYLLKTAYKNINQISYSIKAAGMTVEQLFELRQNQKSLNDMASKNSTPINALPQNELDIFNFLISSNKDVINNAKLLPKEAETIKKPDYGDFKVAYTSNGTLLLFGLQYEAIELDHQKTELLNDFLNEAVNIE